MTANEIYWILKLDDIQGVLIFLTVLVGIYCLIMAVNWGFTKGMAYNYDDKKGEKTAAFCTKQFFITVSVFVVLLLIGTLIPSTKQMAAIKVIPAIANSEIVGAMPNDAKELYRMGVNAIKEQLTGKEQSK